MLIRIEWSESNDGWMYDIFENSEEDESVDGGLCAGTRLDAVAMAMETAEILAPDLLPDFKGDDREELETEE